METDDDLETTQLQSQSSPNIGHMTRNIIQLKNQSLQPQLLKISVHQTLTIRVAHNNSYGFSEIGSIRKKYIFAIEQLDEESEPLEEGHQFEFDRKVFSKVGEYRLVCVNMPKVEAKIIVEKSNSESADQIFDTLSDININQQDLFLKTPVKLAQVKQQEPEQQNVKQLKEQTVGLSNSKSDLEEYERILTEEDGKYSDTLENKYLKYFKEEFKLWRNFFQEQEQKEKKETLKSKHTKNLSLSEVKEIDPKHKSEYESENDSDSEHNSSSIGKGVSIASHLYSHQEILDRNNDDDINSGRKEMKKTNSEYGFNIMRSEEEKEPTLDKISVFGKEEEEINLPPSTVHHSRRSNHESYSNANKNTNEKKKSWVSMSRTQTNSPALREYKKENNFQTWVVEWAKQKEYKPIKVQKKQDHHLIKQFDSYMKNSKQFYSLEFKVAEFLYC